MTLIIPPGFALVSYKFALTGDEEDMITTIGVDLDNFSGQGQLCADILSERWGEGFSATETMTAYSFLGVDVAVGQDGGPPVHFVSILGAFTGEFGGSPLPNNSAHLLHKRTGLPGAQGRGRSYLPPFYLPEGSIDPRGFMTVDAQINMQALVDLSFNVENSVLLHDELSPALAPTPLTALTVDRQIATMRRRLRR